MIDVGGGHGYPVETLTEWKRKQLEQGNSGWRITDDDADQALGSPVSISVSWIGDALRNAGRGGRGGDASGPHSQAGDGGQGGDVAVGTLHLAAGTYPVKVGKGGTRGRPGGQSSIGDFKVGAPTGVDGITSTGILANSAEIRDGLVYLLGGGWTFYVLTGLPGRFAGCVVLTLHVEPDRYPVDEVAQLELLDSADAAHFSRSVPLKIPEQGPGVGRHTFVVGFSVGTSVLGIWSAVIRIDGDELLRLSFDVQQG